MLGIVKIVIPIFWRPKNYTEMLHKLAVFTFWESIILIYFLRRDQRVFGWLDNSVLNLIPNEVLPDQFQFLNIPTIIISGAISCLFFSLQMHNLIQKPFGIRSRFDTQSIFTPLAKLLEIEVTEEIEKRFQAKRNTLMQRIFYKYVSSTKEDTVVDKHDIHQALWLWSNFWVFEEAIFLLLIFCIPFALLGMFNTLLTALGISALLSICMWQMWPRLTGAARSQIEQITDHSNSKTEVEKVIREI